MLGELTKLLGFTGSATAIVILILGLFWKGDEAFNEQFRKRLSSALTNFSIKDVSPNWTSVFLDIFYNIFDEKHFSIRCFIASTIASILFLIFTNAIFNTIDFGETFNWSDFIRGEADQTRYTATILMIFIVNIIGDYLSLLETRIVIRKISDLQGKHLAQLSLLALDFLLSMAIFLILLQLIISPFVYTAMIFGGGTANVASISVDFIIKLLNLDFVLAMLATSLLTSIWLWSYYLGVAAIRMLVTSKPIFSFFQGNLDIQQRPVRSIGVVASFFVAVFFVLLAIAQALF